MGVPVQGHIGTPEFSGCREVWDGGVVTKLWLSNGTNVLMVMRNKLRITEATTFLQLELMGGLLIKEIRRLFNFNFK